MLRFRVCVTSARAPSKSVPRQIGVQTDFCLPHAAEMKSEPHRVSNFLSILGGFCRYRFFHTMTNICRRMATSLH
jgi:hypothetical protein